MTKMDKLKHVFKSHAFPERIEGFSDWAYGNFLANGKIYVDFCSRIVNEDAEMIVIDESRKHKATVQIPGRFINNIDLDLWEFVEDKLKEQNFFS